MSKKTKKSVCVVCGGWVVFVLIYLLLLLFMHISDNQFDIALNLIVFVLSVRRNSTYAIVIIILFKVFDFFHCHIASRVCVCFFVFVFFVLCFVLIFHSPYILEWIMCACVLAAALTASTIKSGLYIQYKHNADK